MTASEAFASIGGNLRGRIATVFEVDVLRRGLQGKILPDWFPSALLAYRIIGARMSLDARLDRSGVGVELLWLSPEQIVSEVRDVEPGVSVSQFGFLPIGACATGSGDPYFLDLRVSDTTDPPLVRIRHDLAGEGRYPLDQLELVETTLSAFLLQCQC